MPREQGRCAVSARLCFRVLALLLLSAAACWIWKLAVTRTSKFGATLRAYEIQMGGSSSAEATVCAASGATAFSWTEVRVGHASGCILADSASGRRVLASFTDANSIRVVSTDTVALSSTGVLLPDKGVAPPKVEVLSTHGLVATVSRTDSTYNLTLTSQADSSGRRPGGVSCAASIRSPMLVRLASPSTRIGIDSQMLPADYTATPIWLQVDSGACVSWTSKANDLVLFSRIHSAQPVEFSSVVVGRKTDGLVVLPSEGSITIYGPAGSSTSTVDSLCLVALRGLYLLRGVATADGITTTIVGTATSVLVTPIADRLTGHAESGILRDPRGVQLVPPQLEAARNQVLAAAAILFAALTLLRFVWDVLIPK
jgi:hypothetical protein